MAPAGGAVTIAIPQGALRGRRLKTSSGRPYCSFQGIPYAKPPVGPLRFKSPEPPEQWSGIRNATAEGNIAPQVDFLLRAKTEYEGDEDCLYLNVYTSKLPTGMKSSLIPVMVWIHGGGFFLGSGDSELYGPDYLMEHDVVLVTINYRLGILGFLSTGDEVIPGNSGMKDQVMALKWVKSNIVHFGGDPGNVTIFGESAGSCSCHLLTLSPSAKGLFQRVICQSGVATEDLVTPRVKENSLQLAKSLGFTGSTSAELLAFMREQPANVLVENLSVDINKGLTIGPTIESNKVPDSFLAMDPMEILKRGEFNSVPMIIGVTSREGLMLMQKVLTDKSATRELNTNFQKILPADLPVKKEDRISIAREIKRFYFENQPLEESTADIFGDLQSDMFILYPSVRAAKIHSSLPAAKPVYFYHFDAVTNLNVFKKLMGAEGFSGASHCDELPYLFSSEKTRDISKGPDTTEGKAIQRMTRLWTNFAKTGNPTPSSDDPLLLAVWTPFKNDNRCYLDITNDGLSVKTELLKKRVDFWQRLYRE